MNRFQAFAAIALPFALSACHASPREDGLDLRTYDVPQGTAASLVKTPPRGGLAALRARMSARPSRARRLAPLAFALAAAALVLVAVGRRRGPDLVAAARQCEDAPEVALGLAPMPAVAVAIDREDRATTALVEVRSSDPRVAFYWVSSTTWRD